MTQSHEALPQDAADLELEAEELQEVLIEGNLSENSTNENALLENDSVSLMADLQRLQAEYANYRKRVERDRSLAHEFAIASILSELLPILDDVDRAKEHGELPGGFKAVADQLNNLGVKFGLERFGEAGSVFDPQIHEALLSSTSADVLMPTASEILQTGYRYKERILRPARVAVTEPE